MISSTQNRRVAGAVRLKKRAMREKDRSFLVEGAQGVLEAIASPSPLRQVFYTEGADARLEKVLAAAIARGIRTDPVSEDVMAHLTSTVTPQGVVAVAEFLDVPLPSVTSQSPAGPRPAPGLVPVLVEVRDPGNAGTILRSADASGAAAVVFTRSSVDVYNAKAVRATAGSLFHVPVVREVEPEEAVAHFRQQGWTVLAADAEGERSVYEVDLRRPTAVLFGNEARGLGDRHAGLADGTIRVPIAGPAESLNLAAAATVVLFESARQRAGVPPGGAGAAAGLGSPMQVGEEDEATSEATLAEIIAGAAHDIRSPLTALKGFVSTLLSRWDRLSDEQRLMMLEGVAADGSRMGTIIAQLVDASRLASGRLELAPVPTDLRDVAERAATETARWSGFEIEVEGGASATTDPARVRTILEALAESAHWWGEDGPVHVDLRQDGPDAVLEVWRQGSALDEEAARALFRPRAPGSGGASKVGLYVAGGLAAALGGTLTARARPDVRLTLRLPRNPAAGA